MDAPFQAAPIGIGRLDPSDRMITVNWEFARLLGVAVDDALGRSLLDIVPSGAGQWRRFLSHTRSSPGLSRDLITEGTPPPSRSLDVVGWPAVEADDASVWLLLSERPADGDTRSLAGAVERARFARDIHDGLAQDLWLAKLTASRLATHATLDAPARVLCAELLRSIDAGLAQVRTAMSAMRSGDKRVIAISELIERHVDEFSDRFGIKVECQIDPAPPIPSRVAAEVLRIVDEALNNVRKHAAARQVEVAVKQQRASLVVSIRDDGRGFDPTHEGLGFGRQSMAERADAIGGQLKVTSAPGRGTTVSLRVPGTQLVALP